MKLYYYGVILFFIIVQGFTIYSINEVHCMCNDHTAQAPDCGICGSQLGSMEKTDTGAYCICSNKLKNGHITCATTCQQHKGWSGNFQL
jgi:hypothetical protein